MIKRGRGGHAATGNTPWTNMIVTLRLSAMGAWREHHWIQDVAMLPTTHAMFASRKVLEVWDIAKDVGGIVLGVEVPKACEPSTCQSVAPCQARWCCLLASLIGLKWMYTHTPPLSRERKWDVEPSLGGGLLQWHLHMVV